MTKALCSKGLARLGLLVYGVWLLKVVLFKVPFSRILLEFMTAEGLQFRLRHAVNLTPFETIAYYLSGSQGYRTALWNLVGNVAVFVPLGFLVPLAILKLGRLRHVALIAFVLSLLLEVTQLITGLGSFDVDDILLNLSGAAVGWVVYKGVAKVLSHIQRDDPVQPDHLA